jgi:hypothetical protein
MTTITDHIESFEKHLLDGGWRDLCTFQTIYSITTDWRMKEKEIQLLTKGIENLLNSLEISRKAGFQLMEERDSLLAKHPKAHEK